MKNSELTGSTVLEAVREAVMLAGGYNSGDAVAPAAILWTDAEGEWLPIVEKLRPLMPELLTLGEYEPEGKTGPAIWLRCVVDRASCGIGIPEGAIPVLYLPRVSRQVLRSPEECPDALKPLVELQYRGAVWTQVNGRDWTIEAFLVTHNGGLGLDVARDQNTRAAMLRALGALAMKPVASLRGRKLESEDFDKMMIGDTVADLLLWTSDPVGTRKSWEDGHWTAFRARCQDEFGFDPESDGDLVAAEKMGRREGAWINVWRRFAESPSLYAGIPAALRRAKPADLFVERDAWPDENEKDEATLRDALAGLGDLSHDKARKIVAELDKSHGQRRTWVWARLGLSPLAAALEHLRTVAEHVGSPVAGATPDAMAAAYTKSTYLADDGALAAMAAVKSAEDQAAVRAALRSIYLPWLEDTARKFQAAIEKSPLPPAKDLGDGAVAAEAKQCVLFVDGLRYDVAQRLLRKLHERQYSTTEGYRWAALPTVTATAKPAVSPIASHIEGGKAGDDFCPVFANSRKPVTAALVRESLESEGYQVLHGLDTGDSQGEEFRAWSESGEYDTLGHKLQAKLASQIGEQLDLLVARIAHLLEAGWKSVRVVTDHGWMLVPGGLPQIPLPKYLANCRWARCAVVTDGAKVDVPQVGWFWDTLQPVAYASGAGCFASGTEYAHGGLSLQECVIPDLTISLGADAQVLFVEIDSVTWLGLRCRVVVKPAAAGLWAELRAKPNVAGSRICEGKALDREGRAGLLVEDEALSGTTTSLVVYNTAGRVIAKQTTIVGGDE